MPLISAIDISEEQKQRHGFTLFELLVALTIAGAALAIFLRGVSENLNSLKISGQYENAISRCKSHLAALGKATALKPGESSGDDGDGYQWHLRIDPIATALISRDRSQASAGTLASRSLYHIDVGISWSHDGKTREVSLKTSLLDQAGQQ